VQRFGYVESSGFMNYRKISTVMQQLYFIRHFTDQLETGRTRRENRQQIVLRKSVSHVLFLLTRKCALLGKRCLICRNIRRNKSHRGYQDSRNLSFVKNHSTVKLPKPTPNFQYQNYIFTQPAFSISAFKLPAQLHPPAQNLTSRSPGSHLSS